ncbi:MAG: pirin family protein [Flavobacteriales bacterium]|nr:pirin family protein [Flavobacteriales bacterium]
MNITIHKADSRGQADHGWLNTSHSFSFAGWYDPDKTNFGLLRVLNDDQVAGGKGFGTHPHDNMEIVSIPLKGSLEHKDSMDTVGVIKENDVQAMSAGTGILHSEYNHKADEPVHFLQIWIFPKVRDIKPRYDEMNFDPALRQNKLQRLVSPIEDGTPSVKINQDAYISRVAIDAGKDIDYNVNKEGNGVYAFVLEGEVVIGGQDLERRDGAGIEGADAFAVKAKSAVDILFIEVPMA